MGLPKDEQKNHEMVYQQHLEQHTRLYLIVIATRHRMPTGHQAEET
jgi:hypothetical protein